MISLQNTNSCSLQLVRGKAESALAHSRLITPTALCSTFNAGLAHLLCKIKAEIARHNRVENNQTTERQTNEAVFISPASLVPVLVSGSRARTALHSNHRCCSICLFGTSDRCFRQAAIRFAICLCRLLSIDLDQRFICTNLRWSGSAGCSNRTTPKIRYLTSTPHMASGHKLSSYTNYSNFTQPCLP